MVGPCPLVVESWRVSVGRAENWPGLDRNIRGVTSHASRSRMWIAMHYATCSLLNVLAWL